MTPRRSYSRHGLNSLMARVKLRGLHAIDHRTTAARAFLAWRQELVADLGGEAVLSAQQRAMIETAVRTRLFLEHLDAWLLGQPSLINAAPRSAWMPCGGSAPRAAAHGEAGPPRVGNDYRLGGRLPRPRRWPPLVRSSPSPKRVWR
jgi:hypothetical protein